MMSRTDQNNQLFSKSLFDDEQINHFLRSRLEKKILLDSSSSNKDNRLCHETKVNNEMKEVNL